jgi:GTP cyclohydrolase I
LSSPRVLENTWSVEDVAFEVALRLGSDPRVTAYEAEVENEESIHAHNAYAFLKRG